MTGWIDTHAHIYSDEFDTDRDAMLAKAWESGLTRIYMPNIDRTSIDGMLELEAKHSTCIPMMGLHPCSVKKDFEKELYIVESWLAKRKFAAVGEMGTDLYWDETFWDQQKEAFKIQANWAKQYNLPLVIHCRESINETIEMVEQLQDGKLGGIFHCFSGSAEQAEKIIKLGFYLGIGGVSTFKNGGLDKVLPEIGIEKLVLETDSPYLAPVPHRGKRNEPSYIPAIGRRVSDILDVEISEVERITSKNALTIFGHD